MLCAGAPKAEVEVIPSPYGPFNTGVGFLDGIGTGRGMSHAQTAPAWAT